MPNRTPITIDDYVMQQNPTDARISPDGRHVAYVLTDAAKEGPGKRATIWLVAADGSAPPRPITAGPRADGAPRWSPDGTRIAFLSDRAKEKEQGVYVLPHGGGEAQRLGDLAGNLSEPAWSPDGATIAVIQQRPDTDAQKAKNEKGDDAYIYGTQRKYAHIQLVDAATGAARQCGPDDLHVWGYAWSADSTQIAFVGSAKPGWAEGFGGTHLYILTVADGTIHEIEGTYGTPSHPAWSPDGKTLAFFARPDRATQGASVLMLHDLAGGTTTTRLATHESGKLDYAWLPDGQTLVVALLHSTALHLHRYIVADDDLSAPLAHFPATGAGDRGANTLFSLDAAGTQIALARSDMTHGQEIWAGPLAGPLAQLTHHQAWLDGRSVARSRVVHWDAADGRQIAGILLTPDPALHGDGPYPFIVQVHGGPAGVYMEDFKVGWSQWAQLLCANGYAVLLPNPRGSSGRGDPFQVLNHRDWGGADMDDILRGVDYAIAEGVADADRTGIGGWSYGGFMTAWTESQTTRFKAAIVGAGLCNLISMYGTTDISVWQEAHFGAPVHEDPAIYWDHSAMKYAKQVTTPTLILHGQSDERVPFAQGQEWATTLHRMGVPTEFVAYPRQPHAIEERAHQRDLLTRVLRWCDLYVKG